MLISYFHLMKTKLGSQGLGFVRWVFGSFSLLVALNLPILRTMMMSRFGDDSLKIQFVLLAFIIAIISWRLSSGYLSVPLFSWQLSTCWFFLCESRFFAVISIFNLLLLFTLLFDLPGIFRFVPYGSQSLLLLVTSIVFPLVPFFIPWIQKIHWLASLLYSSTSTRAVDTWSLNLWHEDALDLATHWPQWISESPDLFLFSQEYRSSVFDTSISPFYYINHTHSLSLQQLLLFDPTSGSLFDVLGSAYPLIFILFLILLVFVIRLRDPYMPSCLNLVYSCTVLLVVGYITTESISVLTVLPVITILPVIQSFGFHSNRLCLAPVRSQSFALSIGAKYLFLMLRSPLALFSAVGVPVILYIVLYLF